MRDSLAIAETSSSQASERRWYVARTHVGREFASTRNLLAERIEAYCPTLPIRGARAVEPDADAFAGRLPMLRGYVFVRPTDTRQLWAVREIRGVFGLLGGVHPLPVTDQAIVELRETESDQSQLLLAPTLRAVWMPETGQLVRVISGSYVGEWVTVIGGDAEKGIVRGLVQIFGALRPAWINVEALDRETAHFPEDEEAPARRPYLKRDGRQKATA